MAFLFFTHVLNYVQYFMLGFSSTLHSTHYLVDFIHCHELSLHLHRNALTFPLSPNCLFMHPHMDISWLPQTKYVHNWIFLILLLFCWATLSWSLVCHPIILAMNMLSLIHLLCHSHTYIFYTECFFDPACLSPCIVGSFFHWVLIRVA